VVRLVTIGPYRPVWGEDPGVLRLELAALRAAA
jgi:hypothetical protein